MNIEEANRYIKNEFNKYSKLKKAFTKIHDAETNNSKKRIEHFEKLFEIKENDNEGLKKIFDLFREEMKKLETNREKHLETLKDLIIPVTDMYPTLLKNEKKNLDELSLDRKNMAKIRPSTSIRSASEKKSEKNYSKFLSQKIKDDKFLFMHFVHSELEYHAIMMEKLTNLFFKINNMEPKAYLKQFAENYNYKNYNFNKLGINIEEIEENEKKIKEKENKEKNEVYTSDEEESSDEIISKSKSKIKNSSIKKSENKKIKKSKNTVKISSEKNDEEEEKQSIIKEEQKIDEE